MDERVVTTPARALADLDCPMVNARMTAAPTSSSPELPKEGDRDRGRKRENRSCGEALGLRCGLPRGHRFIHAMPLRLEKFFDNKIENVIN